MVGCGKKEENINTKDSTIEKQVKETETQDSTQQEVSDINENTKEDLYDEKNNQQLEDVRNKYLQVLRNEETFIDTNNESTPSYMNNIYYGEGVVCTPKKYALVDFDKDGVEEVCVEVDLGFDTEFIVLHYFDGTVYGYSFVYRGMEQIGNNGYYIGSAGAGYMLILSMEFNETEMIENTVAYSELDSENSPVYFDSNKTQMKEADWSSLLAGIQDDTVTWHSFEDSDWEMYLDKE